MLTLVSALLFVISTGLLVWYLLANDHGSKEPVGAIFAAVGFGVLAVVISVWAEIFLPDKGGVGTILVISLLTCLGIGFIEECAKFIPLALFIRNKPYFNEHTDGIIYFAVVGLTFGLIENFVYLFLYKSSAGGGELIGVFRLVVLFFFHAASTGIAGYYFAKAKIHGQSVLKPAIALGILIISHGLYNFMFVFASSKSTAGSADSEAASALAAMAMVAGLVISALLNTFLFLYYRRAQQWDASIGLAIDNKISYAGQTLPAVNQAIYQNYTAQQPMSGAVQALPNTMVNNLAQPNPISPTSTNLPAASNPQTQQL
jgi:protease PrsW